MKKCVYCNVELDNESVVDVCVKCGHGVWGEKMFSAIRENMENARQKGDLHQGSVGGLD
jgi:hypothetical protein